MIEIDRLLASTLNEIQSCCENGKLPLIKAAALGKESAISKIMNSLKDYSPEMKKTIGQEANFAKQKIVDAIKQKEDELSQNELENRLRSEYIDVTMPPRLKKVGKIHPITKTFEESCDILSNLGFSFVDGPDIESDFYNFTALNIPEHHPARTMHDTFYISHLTDDNLLLRTHTSPVQIRAMKEYGAPLRVYSIGRTYRSDSDSTHTPMFHQIEGIVIDKDINFSHLKWVIVEFFKKFFCVDELNIRLRPSFFPFTEPSAEVDMAYTKKNDKFIFGSGDKWLEMGGCGMVHPNVLQHGGIDSDIYQGFAFGWGLERITSLKYGISDLRQYFEYNCNFSDNFYFSHCAK